MSVTTVSTATNPELAGQLAAKAMAPDEKKERPEPVAAPPPDTSVQLPCGYIDKAGELHRDAVVKELNGADEEAMAKSSNPATLLNTILIRGVQTIGGQPAAPELLEKLLAADRDALLVAVRRVTYGDEVEYEVVCPECDYKHDSKVALGTDVPSKTMDDPESRWLHVQTSKGEALVGLPTGKVQSEILAATGKTAAELNTLMLAACVLQIGDRPITSALDVRERMSAKDRKVLLEALSESVYGPQLGEVSRSCPSCSAKIALPMSLIDLFRV